jgi:hypothetical protein
MVRLLLTALVFVLGGLHGGLGSAAQWHGHEDHGVEHHHAALGASAARRIAATEADSSSRIQPSALARPNRGGAPAEAGRERATLLSLRCLFLT